MKINQKGFISVVMAVIVLALFGAGSYFVLKQKSQIPLGPIIEQISPVEALIGAEITITGSGFTSEKNSLQFDTGFAFINNLTSSYGNMIIFTIPESFDTCNPDGSGCAELFSQPIPGKTYQIIVINANGRSNSVNFTVRANKDENITLPLPNKTCSNRCGDGTCQEIVCMGIGCPCSESSQTCPSDCLKSKINPIPSSFKRTPYLKDGTCPPGYVNYGVPLQCVTPEYMESCKNGNLPCPICLAGSTFIDTPSGQVLVKDLQLGMSVWTTDKNGLRISGVITKTSKVPVPPTHQMVHLIIKDGRELFVSPGHPTIDGRIVGNLTNGDLYDGAFVVSVERVFYNEGATYDILPSGDTGFYWANGILIGSTLY